MQKSQLDLFQCANLIYDIRPDILIECGTWHGGSALYYATIMDAINHGTVLTIDAWDWGLRPKHDRIWYVTGSSVDENIAEIVTNTATQVMRIMVILDSDHTKEHVLKELNIYAPLVTRGSYCIVEDTNIHGHPLRQELPEGPWEAVQEWLPKHPNFAIDHQVEPPVTNNPDGWLRRME